jgi:hypothetical protein
MLPSKCRVQIASVSVVSLQCCPQQYFVNTYSKPVSLDIVVVPIGIRPDFVAGQAFTAEEDQDVDQCDDAKAHSLETVNSAQQRPSKANIQAPSNTTHPQSTC